jgi:hypothetical protein
MVSVDRRTALFANRIDRWRLRRIRTVFNEGVDTESDHLQLNGITRAGVKFNTPGLVHIYTIVNKFGLEDSARRRVFC